MRQGARAAASFSTQSPRSYTTTFSASETPISESGAWENIGLDWTLVNTSGGVAFGTQGTGGGFDDSYANLSGVWPADQEITATVFKGTTANIQEVELRFRCNDSVHRSDCYEINFAHDGQYVDFVRWPGPIGTGIGDFTFLVPSQTFTISGGVNNGDVIKGRIQGNTLSAWIDKGSGFAFIGSASDTAGPGGGAVLTVGRPGMGFYRGSTGGAMNQYCFTDYTAVSL